MGRLEDKVAIVTGAARGIGAATARRFAQEGASVVIWDVLEQEGKDLASDLCKTGRAATFDRVDLTKEQQVREATGRVLERFGGIDILVNNAAIPGANKKAHELSENEFDQIFAINVKGVWLCTKHVIPSMMVRKKGSIVNFSSIYGLIGNDDLPPYHATKGAVLMMTKTDAICYAPYGIRVNCVNPGSTKTELFLKAAETYVHGYDAYLAMMKEKHPLTLGEPVDVANCVLFLASDEARFVTGVALPVDGGYTAQ